MRKLIMAVAILATALVAIPGTASAADGPADCAGYKIFYQVEYTDGGVDSGCANGNEVTRAQNPDLLARTLHVSCSDKFGFDGKKIKSDLGGRQVAAYLIVKDLNKDKPKTCGEGTPVPSGGTIGYGIVVVAAAALAGGGALMSRRKFASDSIAV